MLLLVSLKRLGCQLEFVSGTIQSFHFLSKVTQFSKVAVQSLLSTHKFSLFPGVVFTQGFSGVFGGLSGGGVSLGLSGVEGGGVSSGVEGGGVSSGLSGGVVSSGFSGLVLSYM